MTTLSAAALGLALGSAFVHAGWNVLLARRRDPEAASAVALMLALVLYAPLAAATWDVEREVWPYVLASGAFELAYWSLLAYSYGRADLSVVYPVARGLAPVVVLVVAVAVLGVPTSARQVVGILLVCGGILAVRGLRRDELEGGASRGVVIATFIAGYTLVDKQGLEYASPLAYEQLVMLGPSLAYLAAVTRSRGRAVMRRELLRPSTLAIAVGNFGAYALVLYALTLAPAAPVAAVRETSVVVAVALARIFLAERVGRVRLGGAALVAGGTVLLSA